MGGSGTPRRAGRHSGSAVNEIAPFSALRRGLAVTVGEPRKSIPTEPARARFVVSSSAAGASPSLMM